MESQDKPIQKNPRCHTADGKKLTQPMSATNDDHELITISKRPKFGQLGIGQTFPGEIN